MYLIAPVCLLEYNPSSKYDQNGVANVQQSEEINLLIGKRQLKTSSISVSIYYIYIYYKHVRKLAMKYILLLVDYMEC